ncbi:class E sortase [Microbacterium gorillae]|uniref:class E sortase n=1 Tax=Microbacterium gorillae TaxID=1231063 RepID=UPI00058E0748|nr:class E sortase [Microbacterium gorillae]
MTSATVSRRSARRARQRSRVTFTGVLGELLITVGLVVLLYVVWQMWVGDWIMGAQASAAGNEKSQQWSQEASRNGDLPKSSPESPYNTLTADPPAMVEPGRGEYIANIIIPRLGIDKFPIAEGTATYESLDREMVGHYVDNAMPGQEGNFALAGHRGSHGAPFENLPQLHAGDAIVIETQAGWYTYRFRSLEYVTPDSVDVLLPTPQDAAAGVSGRYLTMTTCSPRYGFSERLIAYGVFESFTPREADGKVPASTVLAKGA